MAGPVLLVDAYSLFYRAFYALPEMNTRAGEPTSALYGFATLMLKLVREEQPSAGMFAIDLPRPTFRHRAYAPYKETRIAPPGSLPQQLRRFPSLLDAFGFPVHAAPGFEGDDVLATAARRLAAAGERPLVVTGDHDCLQLARAPIGVLIVSRAGTRAEHYDAPKVRASWGVEPEQVPDWIALVGDPSDNLPGVPGVGPQTAARWINEHGGVPGVLAARERLQPARLRAAVAERAELLTLWRDLATLRDDVPLGDGPLTAPVTPAMADRLRPLFEELEFKSLLARLPA